MNSKICLRCENIRCQTLKNNRLVRIYCNNAISLLSIVVKDDSTRFDENKVYSGYIPQRYKKSWSAFKLKVLNKRNALPYCIYKLEHDLHDLYKHKEGETK